MSATDEVLFHTHPMSRGRIVRWMLEEAGCRYRTELMNIYRQLSMHENPDKAAESIRRMTDPYDNSVNEKCSLIRAAFLKVIADDLAAQYYITGYRGEPKRILLNRELVIQEQ